MKLSEYIKNTGTKQRSFARAIGVSESMAWQWLNDVRPISPKYCPAIEEFTGKKVTRKDLRPNDWAQLWPDLTKKPSRQ